MGWSWSLHLCQSFVSNVLCKSVNSSRLILDKRAGVRFSSHSDIGGAAYVDNSVAILAQDLNCIGCGLGHPLPFRLSNLSRGCPQRAPLASPSFHLLWVLLFASERTDGH